MNIEELIESRQSQSKSFYIFHLYRIRTRIHTDSYCVTPRADDNDTYTGVYLYVYRLSAESTIRQSTMLEF